MSGRKKWKCTGPSNKPHEERFVEDGLECIDCGAKSSHSTGQQKTSSGSTSSPQNTTPSNNNSENIVERFNQLESQFNSLVKSLEQGSHPWGMIKASRVTGAMELPKISRIKASETELIDIYHNSPQILSCLAITVALTPESYQKQTNQIIYLEQVSNGNYWIIITEKNDYWLITKDNIRINANSIKTVQSLFKCEGYEEIGTRKFSLIKPAKLSLMANGKQWKLEELGILDFSNSKAIISTKNYIEQEQIDYKLIQLNQEIWLIKDEYQKTINSLQEKQKLLEQELKKAAQERQQISSKLEQIILINKSLVDHIAKLSNESESKKKVAYDTGRSIKNFLMMTQ